MTTVWVTKSALTEGILKMQVDQTYTLKHGRAYAYRDGRGPVSYYEPDWHLTRKAAVERAEEMVGDEIDNLESRIRELVMMVFEVEE